MQRTETLMQLSELARAAGTDIMRIYQRDFTVQNKADDSPLTEADMASHHRLVAGLQALTPEIPIVSEESGLADYAERRQWTRYWLIDPLDGTKEFIERNGEFTVNIALVENNRPTLGCVGVPAREHIYVGDVMSGFAQRLDANGEHRLRTRSLGKTWVMVASRRHGGERLEGLLKTIESFTSDLQMRNVGSALKLCLLADGEADLYPRLAPTSEWDIAAAQAVLEAAGGRVMQLSGEPLAYNKENILNPEFLAVADRSGPWSALLRAARAS